MFYEWSDWSFKEEVMQAYKEYPKRIFLFPKVFSHNSSSFIWKVCPKTEEEDKKKKIIEQDKKPEGGWTQKQAAQDSDHGLKLPEFKMHLDMI